MTRKWLNWLQIIVIFWQNFQVVNGFILSCRFFVSRPYLWIRDRFFPWLQKTTRIDDLLLKCICCFPFYMQPNVSTEAKKISIYLNMVGKKINWIVIYLKLQIIIICKILLRSYRIRIRPGERVQDCRVETHGNCAPQNPWVRGTKYTC